MRLADFAFHPAIQDGFPQFPTIAQLKCGNLAFGDVTIQGIRGDSQILRRLSHVHHFTRFIHGKHYPRRLGTRAVNPTAWCSPVDAAEPGGARVDFMTPCRSDRQGFLSRSCPKNRGLFQAINGYSGVVMLVLVYQPGWTTTPCGFDPSYLSFRSVNPLSSSPCASSSSGSHRTRVSERQRFPDRVDFRLG